MGDLSKHITVELRGETGALKKMINTMVDQLNVLMAEFTRIAREIGTEGKFGGQLEQAAAYIAAQDKSFADYLTDFRKREIELLEEATPETGGIAMPMRRSIRRFVPPGTSISQPLRRKVLLLRICFDSVPF